MAHRRKKQKLAARPAGRQGLFTSSPLVAVVALVLYGGVLFAGGYFANEWMGGGDGSTPRVQATVNPTSASPTVVGNVSVDDDPYKGSADAKVKVVEFSDYL